MSRGKTTSWSKRLISASAALLGFSSATTQLVLIREFLSVFSGNELVIGIILGNWLLLTGCGAYLGRLIPPKTQASAARLVPFLQLGAAFLPFAGILAVRIVKSFVFPAGVAPGLAQIMLFSLLLLLPYCLVSGLMINLLCRALHQGQGPASIGAVYFLDTLGAIIGSMLLALFLLHFIGHFAVAFILMLLNLAASILLSASMRLRLPAAAASAFLLLSPALLIADIESYTSRYQFPGQEVLARKSTLYGDLAVTRSGSQLNFYENSVLLHSTGDSVMAEETVHYAMSQHPDPGRVLLVSGGITGSLKELLKYDVSSVDYVELDSWIIKLGIGFSVIPESPRLNLISGDAFRLLSSSGRTYDVIILALPEPSTAQLNRFYTLEFMQAASKSLGPSGVISLSMAPAGNYMSGEAIELQSSVYSTMKRVFSNVIVIPGERNYLIASDSELGYGISETMEQRGINATYVKRAYLKAITTEDRLGYVQNAISRGGEINSIFRPVSYYLGIRFWLREHGGSTRIVITLLACFCAAFFLASRKNPLNISIFATGFTASSLLFVFIFAFQSVFGYVYHKLGILVAFFMAGLAAGAYVINWLARGAGIRLYILLELALAAFSFAAVPFLFLAHYLSGIGPSSMAAVSENLLFPMAAVLLAFIVGMEFPLAARLSFRNVPDTAASLYSSDLFGAFLGSVAASAFIVPLFGVVSSCLLIGILNLGSAAFIFLKRKNY